MEDKLISVNAVIAILENVRFRAGKDLSKAYLIADLQEQIERLPAAFDKEKVKVELQTKADRINDELIDADTTEHLIYLKGKEDGFRETIEIFEKGGVG